MNLFALFPPNFSQNIFGTFCKGLFSYWLFPPNSPPPKFFHKPFLLIYFSDFYYLTFPHRLFALNFPPDFFPKLFFKTFFPKPFFPGPSSWLVIQTFPPNFFLFFCEGVGGWSPKHRKNCECCPMSLLIVRLQRLSWIQILNCQNCNQCLKCHKSLRLSLSLF